MEVYQFSSFQYFCKKLHLTFYFILSSFVIANDFGVLLKSLKKSCITYNNFVRLLNAPPTSKRTYSRNSSFYVKIGRIFALIRGISQCYQNCKNNKLFLNWYRMKLGVRLCSPTTTLNKSFGQLSTP